MRREIRMFVAAAVAAAALVAVTGAEAGGRVESAALAGLRLQPYEPRKDAPPLALPDLEGRVRRLEDFRGKALMLFFWATW